MKRIIILLFILIFCANYKIFSIDTTSDLNSENNLLMNINKVYDNSPDEVADDKTDKDDYKIALETSVGFGTGINFGFERTRYKSIAHDIIEYNESFNFNSLYLNIPFSLMFYFKKYSVSIGLSINYNFFIFQNINYTDTALSSSYDNDFVLNQTVNPNFKIKFGNIDKRIRAVCEMGLMINYYYNYNFSDDAESSYNGIEYEHYHRYYVYLGPRLSCGIELVYKNFSFEAGGFIGYLTGSTYSYFNQTYYAWDADIEFDDQTWLSDKDQLTFGFYLSVNFIYFKKIK